MWMFQVHHALNSSFCNNVKLKLENLFCERQKASCICDTCVHPSISSLGIFEFILNINSSNLSWFKSFPKPQ